MALASGSILPSPASTPFLPLPSPPDSSMTSARRHSHQPRPNTYALSLKALLCLPYRLCNPPHPAVGKVRSFGVTPIYSVRLEDVLNRKHLPPLGLKDFEEWLLYVESCPENLYFVLWLKEYTSRYQHWIRSCKPQREAGDYRVSWPVQSSSQLTMFYARAKQTFFTTGSHYELNVPSDILAPFYQNNSPHPDPAVFGEVSAEVHKMLQTSLDRFVVAAYNNVGNNRVLCGMIAGALFSLIGGVPPIAVNFAIGASRWLRLLALPGLWLGLTVLLASLHGVCVGIYIFGDLRQLRKFELARPQISHPKTVPHPSRHRPTISSPLAPPLVARRDSIQPVTVTPHPLSPTQPTRLIIPSPPVAHVHEYSPILTRSSRAPSLYSTSSSGSSSSLTSSEAGDPNAIIDISPAYYDPDPIEGPATTPISLDVNYEFPAKAAHDDDTSFATASFIHPFDPLNSTDFDFKYKECKHSPEDHQPISPFDFDSLPPRLVGPMEKILVIEPQRERISTRFSPRALIERLQSRCNITQWHVAVDDQALSDPEKGWPINEKVVMNADESSPSPPPPSFSPPQDAHISEKQSGRRRAVPSESHVRTQFKLMKAVPAFASPLTRVLSPIVVRGQWEIVVRSCAIAFLLSWMVVGSLLAVPVRR